MREEFLRKIAALASEPVWTDKQWDVCAQVLAPHMAAREARERKIDEAILLVEHHQREILLISVEIGVLKSILIQSGVSTSEEIEAALVKARGNVEWLLT